MADSSPVGVCDVSAVGTTVLVALGSTVREGDGTCVGVIVVSGVADAVQLEEFVSETLAERGDVTVRVRVCEMSGERDGDAVSETFCDSDMVGVTLRMSDAVSVSSMVRVSDLERPGPVAVSVMDGRVLESVTDFDSKIVTDAVPVKVPLLGVSVRESVRVGDGEYEWLLDGGRVKVGWRVSEPVRSRVHVRDGDAVSDPDADSSSVCRVTDADAESEAVIRWPDIDALSVAEWLSVRGLCVSDSDFDWDLPSAEWDWLRLEVLVRVRDTVAPVREADTVCDCVKEYVLEHVRGCDSDTVPDLLALGESAVTVTPWLTVSDGVSSGEKL